MAEPVRIIGHNSASGDANEQLQAQVNRNGSLHVIQEGFTMSDFDDDQDPAYYGFVDRDGRWYIMRKNTRLGQNRFISGDTGYTLNWVNKENLVYDYYYNAY